MKNLYVKLRKKNLPTPNFQAIVFKNGKQYGYLQKLLPKFFRTSEVRKVKKKMRKGYITIESQQKN